jgi:predicted DNA-binding transcriptional regulator YafY
MTQLSTRLARLLNMVPYLRAHPGVTPNKAPPTSG